MPDPHLHAHCFVFNTTWDSREAAWKAGEFGDLMRDAPYFEAKFHSRMARRLASLGIAVERTKAGWEIADVPKSVVKRFSRRTALIEEEADTQGSRRSGGEGGIRREDPRAQAEGLELRPIAGGMGLAAFRR